MTILSICRFKFYLIFIFLLFFKLTGLCATISSTAIGGDWTKESTWESGIRPGVNDHVIIASGATVFLDADIVVFALTIKGTLNTQLTHSLTISNVLSLDEGILNLGNGYLYVGGQMYVIGNGLAKQGALNVNNGTVVVEGNISFWKDKIDGQINGDDARRLLEIEGSGSINVGGTLVGPNGTDAETLAQTNQLVFIFRGGLNNNYWNTAGNWNRGTVPAAINSVVIPVNLIVNLQQGQAIKNIAMAAGSFINLNNNTLSISGDINNNGGSFSGKGNLLFEGTTTNQTYTGSSTASVPNVEVNKEGLTLKLNGSGEFQVVGLIDVKAGTLNSNGNLTLLSTGDNYAQIAPLTGTAKVLGAVNVQSYFRGEKLPKNRGNRMISFPVKDDDQVESLYQQLKKKLFITGPLGPINGFDMGGSAVKYALTLSTYDESEVPATSYIPVPTIHTRTTAGDATILFFRGNRTDSVVQKLNAPFSKPEDLIVNYKGSINFGPIFKSLSYSPNDNDSFNGINAIGNPYPATIDWNKVYETNSAVVENEIRIIKPGGGVATSKNGNVINSGETNTGQYIQPGQGFYVRKRAHAPNATDVKFKFEEAHKASSNIGSRFLSIPNTKLMSASILNNPANNTLTIRPKFLRINIQQNELIDETLVIFSEGYKSALDNEDAIYFSGNPVSIGSLTSDKKIASINAMPDISKIQELKLFINGNVSGDYKISFTDLNAAESDSIFLRDALYPQSLQDLEKKSFYQFNIDKTNPLTYGANRFTIVFKAKPIAAPTIFSANKKKQSVQLIWRAKTVMGVNAFEIEGSTDTINFKKIGYVKTTAINLTPQQYSFIDKNPSSAFNFYRLKQVNDNGSFSYSAIKMVDFSGTLTPVPSIKVFPNPTNDKITVEFSETLKFGVQVSVCDVQGKLVLARTFGVSEAVEFSVNQFATGVYILLIKSKMHEKEISRIKFLVGG